MKKVLIVFKWFILVLILGIGLMYVFKIDYLITAVRTIYFNGHKTAFLDDYPYFSNREVAKGVAQPWALSKEYNQIAATQKLEETHDSLATVAYLIIKNDSVWHESYFDDYDQASKTNSFSMAKSIVSAALGRAILEGKIKGLDQHVIDFLPEIKGTYKEEVTVGDLASMASGLSWDEAYYSPFSIMTRAYFDSDLREMMLGLEFKDKPGTSFSYKSGDTEMLALVLERATGQYLSEYVSEKFWKPMGAEHEALWQIDHKETGIEKAYCCFASNARDLARFGKLYKQFGKWNGETILDSTFVATSIHPRFPESPEYGYGWWMVRHRNQDFFYMRGHLGQFVIVSPKDDVIIVRLGNLKGLERKGDAHSGDLYVYIDEAYEMMNQGK